MYRSSLVAEDMGLLRHLPHATLYRFRYIIHNGCYSVASDSPYVLDEFNKAFPEQEWIVLKYRDEKIFFCAGVLPPRIEWL